MHIEKISYQKTFSIGPYLTDKIGIEASVDESDQSHSDVLITLRNLVDAWHKKANPHLYQQQYDGPRLNPSIQDESLQYSSPPKEINLQDEKKLITIENAKTLEELASLKEGLPDSLRSAYMEKLKQLTSKTK